MGASGVKPRASRGGAPRERAAVTASEVTRLCADNSKIVEMTTWRPQYTFEQGLAETVEFLSVFREVPNLTEVRDRLSEAGRTLVAAMLYARMVDLEKLTGDQAR